MAQRFIIKLGGIKMFNEGKLNWFVSKHDQYVLKIGLIHKKEKINFRFENGMLEFTHHQARFSAKQSETYKFKFTIAEASEFVSNFIENNPEYILPTTNSRDFLNEFRKEISYRYSDGYNHYFQPNPDEDRWTINAAHFYTENELIEKGCFVIYKEE